jgi:hypothetical protein
MSAFTFLSRKVLRYKRPQRQGQHRSLGVWGVGKTHYLNLQNQGAGPSFAREASERSGEPPLLRVVFAQRLHSVPVPYERHRAVIRPREKLRVCAGK